MIIISNYELIAHHSGVFFVKSSEIIPCPCCDGLLRGIGSRERICKHSDGSSMVLIIRRKRCGSCNKIHHELPNLLVPYKRYGAESIESVVGELEPSHVAADESTLYRWRQWYKDWSPYALSALRSIGFRFQLDMLEQVSSVPVQSTLQSIKHLVGESIGWLAKVVRSLSNINLWYIPILHSCPDKDEIDSC